MRRAAVLTMLPLLMFIGACRSGHDSNREVGHWTPIPGDVILTVPTDQVKSAIQLRLDASRPPNVSADRWHHVHTLYSSFGGAPLWFQQNGLDPQRTPALLAALNDANTDALNFDDFPLAALEQALTTVKDAKPPTAVQLADADVLLTSAYVSLGEDLFTGQLDPHKLSQDWHIDPQEEHVDSALVRSLRSDSLGTSIAAMRPNDPGYDGLRQELVTFRELVASGGWAKVPGGRSLAPGDSDSPARLDALRSRLAAESLLPGGGSSVDPAGPAPLGSGRAVYDRTLAGAVAEFQVRHGIGIDSILGGETLTSLNLPASYRLGQIAANLERYRWMPRSFGSRYIVVNVPAFRAEAFDSGQKVLDMKVIVGAEYQNRNTPVFSDSMSYVEFRPYWQVPSSIAKKEIWPKVKADPNYLAAHGYELYNDHGTRRIRQLPGDRNSLGLIKFMFPNDFNIYLHDTPEGQLFDKDVRAFSHGCIRVQKPVDLAAWVLGWPVDSVRAEMQNGPDHHDVSLPHKIPVYIAYFTAYTKDGQLYFGNDLYDRDAQFVPEVAAGAAPSAQTLQALRHLRELAGS